ncbi:MAG: hypothetical protein M1827_000113 [Pycnora praestabilis]|nr:MAG: hypothetical protein M1827_000113 [Pycnora praestabilis]
MVVALTRFKRVLRIARLSVRQLTHTLHLPTAQAELYDNPHAEWLYDILQRLPKLQSLQVHGIPFFDNQSLRCLAGPKQHLPEGRHLQTYGLRLLIASSCENTTTTSLASALLHLPNLVYLDFSSTVGVNNPLVLSNLALLHNLQVLKLRNCGLHDEDIEVLSPALGTKVRSLDLRSNYLTDSSVSSLLRSCFQSLGLLPLNVTSLLQRAALDGWDMEDWPMGLPGRPDSRTPTAYTGEDLDVLLCDQLTSGFMGRLPVEDWSRTGITHLMIADNKFTVSGLARLLRTTRLHVLDCGTFGSIDGSRRTDSLTSPFTPELSGVPIGAEKLIPVLSEYAYCNLTYLRVPYTIVTEIAPSLSEGGERSTGQFIELDATEVRPELEGADAFFELPTESEPRFELPGDCIHFTVSPAVEFRKKAFDGFDEPLQHDNRRRSACAPEAVLKDSDSDSTSCGFSAHDGNSNRNGSALDQESGKEAEYVTTERRELLKAIEDLQRRLRTYGIKPHGLKPSMLPNLRTLVLTGVPSTSRNRHTVTALSEFIRDCAEETKLATLQARIEQLKYSQMRSVRDRESYLRKRVSGIFSLRKITLEMAAGHVDARAALDMSRTPTRPTLLKSKSIIGDPDSDAFMEASENDFSFFGDEECGLPALEPGIRLPMSSSSEKIFVASPPFVNSVRREPVPLIETVQELSKFRQESKAAYEAGIQRGHSHIAALPQGYWPGEIKVVRPTLSSGILVGKVDCYGNIFKNGIYR